MPSHLCSSFQFSYCWRLFLNKYANPEKREVIMRNPIDATELGATTTKDSASSCNKGLLLQCSPINRADSRFARSQWETVLLCNDVSHWLGASLESALNKPRGRKKSTSTCPRRVILPFGRVEFGIFKHDLLKKRGKNSVRTGWIKNSFLPLKPIPQIQQYMTQLPDNTSFCKRNVSIFCIRLRCNPVNTRELPQCSVKPSMYFEKKKKPLRKSDELCVFFLPSEQWWLHETTTKLEHTSDFVPYLVPQLYRNPISQIYRWAMGCLMWVSWDQINQKISHLESIHSGLRLWEELKT